MKGFVDHSGGDKFVALAASKSHFADFDQLVGALDPKGRPRVWARAHQPRLLGQMGTLFMPGPGLETEAWNRMVLDHIVPKLVLGLRGAVLDASAAEGGGSAWQPLQWAQRWESLLPGTVYAARIEHELLFKWLGALHRWLSAPGAPPDIGAVMEWYEGW